MKVRLQVQGQLGLNKYSGSFFRNTFQIFREEGIRGAFKGVGPALLTVPIFWAVYWPIYNKMKLNFHQFHPELPLYISHLLSAISAGAVGDIITNPFWVTRTRLQTLSMHKDRNIAANISSFDMMRTIYRDEGWKAFYKGLGASFLGLTHVAIQFPLCKGTTRHVFLTAYTYLHTYLPRSLNLNHDLNMIDEYLKVLMRTHMGEEGSVCAVCVIKV